MYNEGMSSVRNVQEKKSRTNTATEPKREPIAKREPLAKKETLYFLFAVFTLGLAGDIMWWQSKQMSDEAENSAAMYVGARSFDYGEIDRMEESIADLESDAARELDALQLVE